MKRLRYTLLSIIAFILILGSITTNSSIRDEAPPMNVDGNARYDFPKAEIAEFQEPSLSSRYLVIDNPDSSLPSFATDWMQLLSEMGIIAQHYSADQIIADPSHIKDARVVILDSSLGEDNGSSLQDSFIQNLISFDVSLILTGRSAWSYYRMRNMQAPPIQTASYSTTLYSDAAHQEAVYLLAPYQIAVPCEISSEVSPLLPVYESQRENSRMVNLTLADTPAALPAVRYESYPLDSFLFAPDDPRSLTSAGRELAVNLIAYADALRESTTTLSLMDAQNRCNDTFAGGLHYMHEPTIEAASQSVAMAKALMNETGFTSWKLNRQPKLLNILETAYVEFETEAAFSDYASSEQVSLSATARAIYLIYTMSLESYFDSAKVATYLSSRQTSEGGFGNSILVTYEVLNGLSIGGYLESIDKDSAESWLRDCVIDGTKTSNPDLWGGIAMNPSGLTPRNSYAYAYVSSLHLLARNHHDPLKLTSWITTRTAVGDGSFANSLSSSTELVLGTACAVSTMSIMGTLSQQNRTTSLAWLTANQQPSGGYGLSTLEADILGKTQETYYVALYINELGAESSVITDGILDYLSLIETDLGFELMDPVPSLMWTSWMSSIARRVHANDFVDFSLGQDYLARMDSWAQYPYWSNVTAISSPEYRASSYRMQSVWTQLFGVSSAQAFGLTPSESQRSQTSTYIAQCQYFTGHYRPTGFSGTAHMQHTVAAVETLYLLNALDSISDRASLEDAVLSNYDSGIWSSDGWTLSPFADDQSAIDWLSTRTALRLGLISPSMASEIKATILSRIQYTDLWSLSRDVATLALLNASGHEVSLDPVDSELVLLSLGENAFHNGWYNSTNLWQPIFTDGVLEMVSILGLRTEVASPKTTYLHAAISPAVVLGNAVDVSVEITSAKGNHSVGVHAFGEWQEFSEIPSSDVLSIPTPNTYDALGSQLIHIVVLDFGHVRAFNANTTVVNSSIIGSMTLNSLEVLKGDDILGSISWTLETGENTDECSLTVRLGDEVTYQQWYATASSPYILSIPTHDFVGGVYNLTVIVSSDYCSNLELVESITIHNPIETYLDDPGELSTDVRTELEIPWALRFASNGSIVAGQAASITIRDAADLVIHSEYDASGKFHWIPGERGNFTYLIEYGGNGSLTECQVENFILVLQDAEIIWSLDGAYDQYHDALLAGELLTVAGDPLGNSEVHIRITDPHGTLVFDVFASTNASGSFVVEIYLMENGLYECRASFLGDEFLRSTSTEDQFISWTWTTLDFEGLLDEGIVDESVIIDVELSDGGSNPLPECQLILTITYLSNNLTEEILLQTNSAGHISYSWIPQSAGEYEVHVSYLGLFSRGSSDNAANLIIRLGVLLDISIPLSFSVGYEASLEVQVTDQNGSPLHNHDVDLEISTESGVVVFIATLTSYDGLLLFNWTPDRRGPHNISLSSPRQNWYDYARISPIVEVIDTPSVFISYNEYVTAPVDLEITIFLTGSMNDELAGMTIECVTTLDGILLVSGMETSSIDGIVLFVVPIQSPGILEVQVHLPAQEWITGAENQSSAAIRGTTLLTISGTGFPVRQGKTVGYSATLLDYNGTPIPNALLLFTISDSQGMTLSSLNKTTDSDGVGVIAYQFTQVGDYFISVSYYGSQWNAPTTSEATQRVYVVPNVLATHNPSYTLDEQVSIGLALTDVFGNYIPHRSILVNIFLDDKLVFDAQLQTVDGFATVHWSSFNRGLARIEVLHPGDVYYYSNSSLSTTSIMELVTADLNLSKTSCNVFEIVMIEYYLTSLNPEGVSIQFTVFGVDLIPVWSVTSVTNASGFASEEYVADDQFGILQVEAYPLEHQFLLGGAKSQQLTVKTECSVSVSPVLQPPMISNEVNLSFVLSSQLFTPIDGITITIKVYDPRNEPVKLGTWSTSASVQILEGLGYLTFSPEMAGLYSVEVSFGGSNIVHSFQKESSFTVYAPTGIKIDDVANDIRVRDNVTLIANLSDHLGNAMADRNILVAFHGPRSTVLGPYYLISNSTGYISFTQELALEGAWSVEIDFEGLGVYLPSTASLQINVRYGTELEIAPIEPVDPIAGAMPVNLSLLLTDSEGNPLEGFTVKYFVYHETLGKLCEQSVIQASHLPEILEIHFDYGGGYTILVRFEGTQHYFPSTAATEFFVKGRTFVSLNGVKTADRSQNLSLEIWLQDEFGTTLNPDTLPLSLEMRGPEGTISLEERLVFEDYIYRISVLGLKPGVYSLDMDVDDSVTRLGNSTAYVFNITATTAFKMVCSDLSGILGEDHYLCMQLIDSLGEVQETSVFLSIYDPDAKEIYGNPLTTKTEITMGSDGFGVSWTPTKTGYYLVRLVYLSSCEYVKGSEFEMKILSRHATSLTLSHFSILRYGEDFKASLSVYGGMGKINGANVTLKFILLESVVDEREYVTTSRGSVDLQIKGLRAGNYTVILSYNGSDVFAPCEYASHFLVTPVVEIRLSSVQNAYLSHNCTLILEVDVAGVCSTWSGLLEVLLLGPDGYSIQWNRNITSLSSISHSAYMTTVGLYNLTVHLHDLPVIDVAKSLFSFQVSAVPLHMTIDIAVSPLLATGAVVFIVAVLIKKKFDGLVSSFPAEWG